jgi:hypothetical protein
MKAAGMVCRYEATCLREASNFDTGTFNEDHLGGNEGGDL